MQGNKQESLYSNQYCKRAPEQLQSPIGSLNQKLESNFSLIKSQVQIQKDLQQKIETQDKKEEKNQILQLSQEELLCKICYKYAMQGVNCKNEKCFFLCCEECASKSLTQNGNKCPYCRISPFEYSESPLRSKINKIQLTCRFCQTTFSLSQEQQHYKRNCEFFKKTRCQFCEQRLLLSEVVKHIRFYHEEKIDEIIEKMFSTPAAIYDPTEVVLRNKDYLQSIDKTPHLGTTGKFYCGGRLQGPKCTCCNGFCGPSNGQNCVQCMKLDMKRLGLKKGFLVNSNGNVCWKKGDYFICGIMGSYGSCKEGEACSGCKCMRRNVNRYISLMSD